MYTLRPYQERAVKQAIEYFTTEKYAKNAKPVIVAPTGAGKSLLVAKIAQELGESVLALQPTKELLEQNYGKFIDYGGEASIYSASMNSKEVSGGVTFATIGSITKKPELFQHIKYVVIDECFVGDTIIETTKGGKPIRDIKIGESVINATGFGTVEAKSIRSTNCLVVLKTVDTEIVCTPNHPIKTDKGWVEARHITPKDVVYIYGLQKNTQGMSRMWQDFFRNKSKKVLQYELFFKKAIKGKLYEKSFNKEKSLRNIKKNRTQTNNTGWQRSCSSNGVFYVSLFKHIRKRVGAWLCSKNKQKERSSTSLQNRHCQSYKKNSPRNRWILPFFIRSKKKRQQKRNLFNRTRVESVQTIKYGDNEWNNRGFEREVQVFNLQISNHPSYVAGGVLVHNCHLVPPEKTSMYQRFFSEIDAKIIGLTATPFRLKNFRDPFTGMPYSQINLLPRMKPRVFTDIIDVTQISEMYEEGFLTPIEYVPLEWGAGKLKVNSTGAEYTDESMREAIKEQKVLERVPEIAERMLAKVCNHVLVFTTSIENAEFLNESSNMPSAVVHSKMKKKDREQVLIDFKAGKIKVVYNVGVLTTGFDFPELDGIILARPTLSLALYMQMIGRGVRLSPGKKKCTVTDMCGNYSRFGAIEELRYEKDYRGLWELKKGDQVLNNKPIV